MEKGVCERWEVGGASSGKRNFIPLTESERSMYSKYFGENQFKNQGDGYITFNSVQNNGDTAYIVTNRLLNSINGNLVLMVDNNKAIYLKDYNIKSAAYGGGGKPYYSAYVVKVNRNDFNKVYTFRSDFSKSPKLKRELTFNDLVEKAKRFENRKIGLNLKPLSNGDFKRIGR